MKVERFEDLNIWKLAIILAKDIYQTTNQPVFKKDFGLSSQIQRAVVSISANIVEGYEKDNNNEFIRFLKIAKGSCGEVRNHLYIAREIGYLNEKQFKNLHEKAIILIKKIATFLNYLIKKRNKGEFLNK